MMATRLILVMFAASLVMFVTGLVLQIFWNNDIPRLLALAGACGWWMSASAAESLHHLRSDDTDDKTAD
jgi:hypothetical protein